MRKALIKALVVAIVLALGALAPAEAQGPYRNGGAVSPGVQLGWGPPFVLTYCLMASDGFFYAVGPAGYAYTNNPVLVAAISPACSLGNLISVYITSLSPFDWDMAIIYPRLP